MFKLKHRSTPLYRFTRPNTSNSVTDPEPWTVQRIRISPEWCDCRLNVRLRLKGEKVDPCHEENRGPRLGFTCCPSRDEAEDPPHKEGPPLVHLPKLFDRPPVVPSHPQRRP